MVTKISTVKVKDYLKTIITECPKWYIGQMDENQEQAISLYANRRQLEDNSKYKNLKSYGLKIIIKPKQRQTKYMNY